MHTEISEEHVWRDCTDCSNLFHSVVGYIRSMRKFPSIKKKEGTSMNICSPKG